MNRRIASRSREFWERFAPWAGATWLGEQFPTSVGGLSRNGWCGALTRARTEWPELPWLHTIKGQKPLIPSGEPPKPVYDDELEPGQTFVRANDPAPDLTTEEKIRRDREIRRLTSKLSEVEAKYEESLRGSEVEDRICDAIDVRMASLPAIHPPTFVRSQKHRPESVVALLSDAHIGEVVTEEETGGLNAYDFDTFCRRWQYHVDSIGGICHGKLTGYDLPELVLVSLGDMVSGIIHDELVETSDGTLMDWLIDGSMQIAQGIRQLAAEFPTVRVEWHFGNHGRVTQKPRYKRRWVNYDYLLGHMVSRELVNQTNVQFTNHKSFWSLTEVQNHHLLNLHGDNIKGWAGIPVYGINRAVGNLSALMSANRRRFDVVNLGHFHQTALLERVDCDVVLNGSMVGGNEYSYGALFTGSKPRQVLYGMHPERGMTWRYALDLSHGDSKESRFPR